MRHSTLDLERARWIVQDGERRIAVQEALIERLRADGHNTDQAKDFLRRMHELHRLQVKLRDDLERLIKSLNIQSEPPPETQTDTDDR